ncbi:phosphoesterase [Acetobacteraceae bacterium KSS8]|uniref:Phosphoesterase n=1 Tax=Endosaccharibacter trunci TaxID=2812733 RepID=A0ABT1W9L2_9PROT|nr:phosphoesterase [Acetobacteraceae bacterium KSS8]
MTFRTRCRSSCATILTLSIMAQPVMANAQEAPGAVTIGPRSSALVGSFTTDLSRQPYLSTAQKVALLRKKVKYVFVLFQENRSFDFYFGTFPGARGLFSQSADRTPGFTQKIVNTDGTVGTVSPFLIPQTVTDVNGKTVQIYPADTASTDHSHTGIVNSQHFVNDVSLNDRFALNEEGLTTNASGQIVSRTTGLPASANPTLEQKQMGELVMGHVDCDTAPYMWQFADRFAMFDDFHMTITSASTPNAIAMIAGQTGLTQWALHPDEASSNVASPVVAKSGGVPMVTDLGPFAGSNLDTSPIKPPYGPNDESPATPTLNQTYASLPLSFMGRAVRKDTSTDQNPALDLADVQHDMDTIAGTGRKPTNWGWFQEGYDAEPTDTAAYPEHSSYITHHNAPQYFGYVGDNPQLTQKHLYGLNDFFLAIKYRMLPSDGGVAYVRGGYDNNDGLKAVDPNPAVQQAFLGGDDHPGYSDLQISEQQLADEVNAIAQSPYWKDSAIIITYDETDGLYDHDAVHTRVKDPEGNALEPSSRIPAIVISPYAKAHAIVRERSEHSSIIKFVDRLFDLIPLADLPDEVRGRRLGKRQEGQDFMGPADDNTPGVGDMLAAFDNARLTGQAPPLPASYAEIEPDAKPSLPHYPSGGCYMLNIVPTDYRNGRLIDPAPADFNPRPSTTPGIPTSGTWTP